MGGSTTPDPSAAILPLETERGSKPHKQIRHRQRRVCLISCCCCLLTLLIIVLVSVILFLTLFKPHNPTTTILSVTVDGIATNVSFPTLQLHLNISLDILIAVHNPNHASFQGQKGTTEINYRGTLIGTADIEPGKIPERGTGTVTCRTTILTDAFGTQLFTLAQDALSGSMELDTSSRIPGRVKFLGFIKKSAVATAKCTIVVGFPDLKVRSQQCSQKTKL